MTLRVEIKIADICKLIQTCRIILKVNLLYHYKTKRIRRCIFVYLNIEHTGKLKIKKEFRKIEALYVFLFFYDKIIFVLNIENVLKLQ